MPPSAILRAVKALAPKRPASALAGAFHDAFRRALNQSADPTDPQVVLRAAATACRGELASRWSETQREDFARRARRINYLSMEFLMGRALGNALAALDLDAGCAATASAASRALADLLERESDAALGNGGLGRLAACFLDSFATLGLPSSATACATSTACSRSASSDGRQVEHPDRWLQAGNPWDIARPELRYPVGFGGPVEGPTAAARRWAAGRGASTPTPSTSSCRGTARDRVSTLRQWQARALESRSTSPPSAAASSMPPAAPRARPTR